MKRKLIQNNPDEVVRILFKRFGIKYNAIAACCHQSHPQYPSFASIAYVLRHYGVNNCLIKTNIEELSELPKPLIIEYDGLFLPISNISEKEISIMDEKGRNIKEPRTMLQHFWSKTALIFDVDNIHKRQSLAVELFRHYFNKTMRYIVIASIFLFYLFLFGRTAIEYTWANYVFLVTSIIGLIISILFQIQEFDRSNKFINRICHSGQPHGSRDCSSILDSQEARFLGLFSWADFGTLYFFYLLILPIFIATDIAEAITILFSLLATLYIPYSLIYQWKVARKWCTLCLMTQGVLLVNAGLSIGIWLSGGILFQSLGEIKAINIALIVGILATAIFTTTKIFLKTYRNRGLNSKYFAALKHDYAIKSHILQNQKQVLTEGLDKIILNPTGKDILTVVFNPVCTPCMRKMRQLLEILKRKGDTRLELIFLIDPTDTSARELAQIFLKRYAQNPEQFPKFLSDYVIHFPASSNRYKMNSDNKKLNQILKIQDKWCADNGITSTPTMFLNGSQIPALYDINDIDYMIF